MKGQEIRAIRKKLEMSQDAFASEIEVSQAAVSDWERGRTSPNSENIRAIAKLQGDFERSQVAKYGGHRIASVEEVKNAITTFDLRELVEVNDFVAGKIREDFFALADVKNKSSTDVSVEKALGDVVAKVGLKELSRILSKAINDNLESVESNKVQPMTHIGQFVRRKLMEMGYIPETPAFITGVELLLKWCGDESEDIVKIREIVTGNAEADEDVLPIIANALRRVTGDSTITHQELVNIKESCDSDHLDDSTRSIQNPR